MRTVVNFLLYSNLFVALCAAVLTWGTARAYGTDQAVPLRLIGFVFCATLASYLLHRLVDLQRPGDHAFAETMRWSRHNRKWLSGLFILAVGGGALAFFALSPSAKWLTLGLAGIAVFYSVPLPGAGLRLRELPFVKIGWVALVWATVTVSLPLVGSTSLLSTTHLAVWFERFVFIFIITLPFDLRDVPFDRRDGLRTLAAELGPRPTVRLALLGCVLLLVVPPVVFPELFSWSEQAFYLLVAPFLWRADVERNDSFYVGWIDGLMLLRGLWIFAGQC